MIKRERWPEGKDFALTVFDDTDYSTIERIEPVYRFLSELGFRTTKSVWPLASATNTRIGGATLEDRGYLEFVLQLQDRGFEIGLHNVRNHDSPRDVIQQGFEEFRRLIGYYPSIHCNHSMNRENIYWGARRMETPVFRWAYNGATRFTRYNYFQGHIAESSFFWGDLCKEHIRYVRNFVFDEINLNRVNPTMPYHDAQKPFVKSWFSSCEGSSVTSFCRTLCETNQDRLAAEGGVCIMYTHFANGFVRDGVLHREFERLMRRLAKMNGWFVPVSTVLRYLENVRGPQVISRRERAQMEYRWFMSKLLRGTS
jgi:hypothetical protein